MVEKSRNSITLTKIYKDAIMDLVDSGMYIDLQDAMREALRDLFKKHDLHPFKTTKPEDCPEP
ncbi:unnamed protein product [marine sediment metagenome]|uniref:Ribbon-helix-helix protein CopG domain-containing protein n=1 Tax=marine sediment metagenome TaxID=412755 RepID=X1LE01_9ZZZZ